MHRADGRPFDPDLLERVRRHFRRELTKVQSGPAAEASDCAGSAPGAAGDTGAQFRELHLALLEARRLELVRIRHLGTASSAARNRALTILDAEQISNELRSLPA
ncbi:MAG: hypothetical protein ACOH17_01720 [Cellulomonas sp.]